MKEKKKRLELRTDVMYDPVGGFWVEQRDEVLRIGFSPLNQESSGTFVAVSFMQAGDNIKKNDSFGSVEAEKHVGHLISPVSGTIRRTNEIVVKNPRLMNTDPYGEGWLIELEPGGFDTEFESLIYGEKAIREWYDEELKKYNEKGWLAQES